MKPIVEICCGSYSDALSAAHAGATRIELNSALSLGGLTPSLATLIKVKQDTSLKVIAMVRPRGAGFCYDYCSKGKEIPYHAGNQLRLRASVRSTRYHLFRSGRRSTWNSRRTINANKMIQIYLKFLPSKSGILGRTCFCERSTS